MIGTIGTKLVSEQILSLYRLIHSLPQGKVRIELTTDE